MQLSALRQFTWWIHRRFPSSLKWILNKTYASTECSRRRYRGDIFIICDAEQTNIKSALPGDIFITGDVEQTNIKSK